MPSMIRLDPVGDLVALREAVDRLFEQAMSMSRSRFAGTTEEGCVSFPVDVYDTDNEVVVRAALPGVREQDLEILARGNTLTVRADKKYEREEAEANDLGESYSSKENGHACYFRRVELPTLVDADKANASLENGILNVRIAKSEMAKPKRIRISALAR